MPAKRFTGVSIGVVDEAASAAVTGARFREGALAAFAEGSAPAWAVRRFGGMACWAVKVQGCAKSTSFAFRRARMRRKRAAASPDLPLITTLSFSSSPKRPRRLPPESTPVHRLPIDVLALLFGFLPFRPRLVVVARVCKRWNVAVARSVSELYLPPIALLPELLARYRSVSALYLAGP